MQKFVLRKQRLKITRTLAAKHDLLRMWLISTRPPNHGIQSQAMERSTFSSGPQNCRAFMHAWVDLSRLQLNARSQIQSMFLPLRNFIILKKCRKQFAIMVVVGNVDKVEIDEKLRGTEEAHSQGDVTEYTLEERKEYSLLR